MFSHIQIFMDCKTRHIDVLLAHCKGKYQLTAKFLT